MKPFFHKNPDAYTYKWYYKDLTSTSVVLTVDETSLSGDEAPMLEVKDATETNRYIIFKDLVTGKLDRTNLRLKCTDMTIDSTGQSVEKYFMIQVVVDETGVIKENSIKMR